MNRTKLKNILKAISPKSTEVDFAPFDNELTKLKEKLKEQVVVKTLEDVNVALEKNRKQINFEPLTSAFDSLKQDIETKNVELVDILNSKQEELSLLIQENSNENTDQIQALVAEVAILSAKKIELPDFAKQIGDTEKKLLSVIQTAKDMDELQDEKNSEEIQKQFAAFEKEMKKIRTEFQQRGGGSMNRKITFGGVDYLTRYTDINYKAGSNVTFTVVNNNTTKMVDVTVASTGGAGGTIRSINSVSISTAAAAVAATDYVYLCSGTITLTLPDATASNTNLYTIKNVGTGVITINTTSAQTIDGSLTITLPTQYTAVDLISDTANWGVT